MQLSKEETQLSRSNTYREVKDLLKRSAEELRRKIEAFRRTVRAFKRIRKFFKHRYGNKSLISSPSSQSYLDTALCWFSDVDPFTFRDAFEGICIFGGVGSGKSSASGRTIALAFLGSKMGGVILCAKVGEREVWQKYAEETGRSDDLIIISPESGLRFNPLHYMMTSKSGAALTENIVRIISDSLNIAGGNNNVGDGESSLYFILTKEQLIRNGVDLFKLSGEKLSITGLFRLVRSAPRLADLEDIEWQKKSYCYELIIKARSRVRDLDDDSTDREDFKACVEFWLDEYPNIPDKTRENIKSTFTSSLEPLTRGILSNLFSSDVDVRPEDAFNGKIIIVDYPVKEYLSAGTFIQTIFKKLFCQAAERRRINSDTPPVFLFVDEAQNFVDKSDMDFFATSRSARVCSVYLSQNINNYYSKIDNKAVVDAILANLSTKIFHANNDYNTNRFASDHIGRGIRETFSHNTTLSQQSANDAFENTFIFDRPASNASSSSSVSETFDYQVEPNDFFKLRKGGHSNGLEVDAIVVQSGRIWNITGKNWLKTTFSQN